MACFVLSSYSLYHTPAKEPWYHGTRVRTRVRTRVPMSACISSRFEIMLYLYVHVHVLYVPVYVPWYHGTKIGTTGTNGTRVMVHVFVQHICTYNIISKSTIGTIYPHVYQWYTCTMVARYCHINTRLWPYSRVPLVPFGTMVQRTR